jgi:hypothetical protein
VKNVREVYFEDEGVAGEDNGQPVRREECPDETKTYKLKIIKLNDEEETREVKITVKPKPKAPADLQIDAILQEGFELSWNDNSTDESGFKLYNVDTNEKLKTFDEDDTSGQITDLTCGTAYRLYLVSYNDVGESAPSNIVTEQTLDCP